MHARRRTGWCRFSLALTQILHACLVISMVKLYYYCMVTLVLTSATSLQATGATEPASKQNQEWIVDRAHIPVQVLRRPGRMEILCGGAAQCTCATPPMMLTRGNQNHCRRDARASRRSSRLRSARTTRRAEPSSGLATCH